MDAALTEADGAEGAIEQRRRLFDSLPIRQRLTGEQAAARSLLIKRLRIALPVVAVVLVLALVLNTNSRKGDEASLEDFTNLDATPKELQMADLQFAGVDDEGHPYDITAEAAMRAPGSREIVQLVKPRAVTTGVDVRTEVTANKGVFKTKENILDLTDGVTLNHSVGDETYVFKTPSARVSIRDETVQSTTGIEGESGSGTLRADRMRAYNGEGRTVFEGNVSMRIFPKKLKSADKPKQQDEGSQ